MSGAEHQVFANPWEFLMFIKFSPAMLKLITVCFCTFVCSSTAVIVAAAPFGPF